MLEHLLKRTISELAIIWSYRRVTSTILLNQSMPHPPWNDCATMTACS